MANKISVSLTLAELDMIISEVDNRSFTVDQDIRDCPDNEFFIEEKKLAIKLVNKLEKIKADKLAEEEARIDKNMGMFK